MRLAQIPTRTLDHYDLSRAEAREEARAGLLWATPERQHVAVAPTAEAAAWMLGVERVEPVHCSPLPEEILWDLRRKARQARALSRRLGRVEVELPRGGIGVPMILGESSVADAIDAMRYATTQGAPLVWSQSAGSSDDVHPAWPKTGPLTQEWVRRILEEP